MSHDISTGVEGEEAHGDVTVDELDLASELAGADGAVATSDVAEYALWLGDDALILAQQLGWWISRAPELEEDVALGNIGLDVLGHARSFLRYAGTADGRSEDDLAYWRDEPDFRSAWLFEAPNGHFGDTIARQLVASAFQLKLYRRLADSADPALAAIATKSVKEVAYHLDHATQWTLRLGGGTELSHARIQQSLVDVWPLVDELFRDEPLVDRLEGIAVRPSTLREPVLARIRAILDAAGLEEPSVEPSMAGGRRGRHSTRLGYLLAEMQVLARAHPGASW
ncbi:1,2-phenylacetyl-CoA epoxidase subunit PaaC [Agrococcus sp. SGAir0287]|uniref:1,2-phenylacetyl-CoA epoxidase subunit PaaC n=1 Tax=Agrococcus sp. SGAir0287 TaxID=2070347 RepID=UPI0015860F2B|nr:1,2-phenylacetyl-CoA epoxidase subunit PaaC [Agrococcus sp. SGAir0287]